MVDVTVPIGASDGTSDCEAVRDSLLSQPVLAVSSLSFVAAGAWLLWAWRDLPAPQRWPARTYAGLLVLVGVGSVDFHGPQSPAAAVQHDLPIVLLIGQAVAVPVSRLLRRRPVLHHGGRPRADLAAGLAVLASAAYAAGRTGSPWCRPESWGQPHAVWHVLIACALAVWGSALWGPLLRGLTAGVGSDGGE
jgi:hypothetical protein